MSPLRRRLRRPRTWILIAGMAYVLFGLAWIYGSDTLLAQLQLDAATAQAVAMTKGWLFVALSAAWGVAMAWLSQPVRESGMPSEAQDTPHRLLIWLLLFALAIPLVDAGIYVLQRERLEADAYTYLSSTARLRATALNRWQAEQRASAERVATGEALIEVLQTDKLRPRHERNLLTLAVSQGFSGLRVMDAMGEVIAEVGEIRGHIPEPKKPTELGESRSGVRVHLKIHPDSGAFMHMHAPVAVDGELIGWVELAPGSDNELSAFLGTDSMLNGHAEVLLALPENDQVRLLRADQSTDLVEQIVDNRNDLPAGIAISQSEPGQDVGNDYRGVPVLFAFAPVGDSPWRIVAKFDRSKVVEPLLPLMVWISALLALLYLLLAASLTVIWRKQRRIAALRVKSMRESTDRLMRQFFELPFVGMAFTSPESKRWLRFNDRLCEILGYPPEELEQLSWSEITHPDDIAKDVAEFDSVMRGERDSYALEKRFIRKDGAIVHALIDVHAVRRADTSIEIFVATVDDITEDVRAREALQASEARWRQIVSEAPSPIMVHNESGAVLAISRSWSELSGYAPERISSLEAWITLAHPPERRDLVRASIARLYSLVGRRDEGEFTIRCADGSERTWQFSSMALGRDAQGLRQMVTMAADVTQQRELADHLRESATLYREMFDSNPIAMYAWDADTLDILAANQAAVSRYGWSVEELRAMTIAQLRPAAELPKLESVLGLLSRDRVNKVGVWTHQRRDGSLLRVEVSTHAMRYGDRPAWLSMAVDVSEREAARAERDRYVAKLEQATESTLAVISTMVELRDPYTAGHEHRVGEIAAAIAAKMGLSADMQHGLRLCGAVHDVGKIAVPAEILSKPTRLNAAEYQIVQRHTELGYDILKTVDLPWPLAEVARQHHERMDGSGYPRGLKGEEILLEARIVAVADVIESMASHRPYRPSIGLDLALAEVSSGSGRLYDPVVVAACLTLFREDAYVLPI